MTEANGKRGPRSEVSNGEGGPTFPVQQYLEKRDGQPYLPLKWRVAWLRADHPHARINTELASHEGNVAVFKAEVQLPEGGAATGWGAKARPTLAGHFDSDGLDYLVEAENQALSRALAALGYGTEYALDFDPPAENQAIPLPEGVHFSEPVEDEEEPGIEVPMEEPAPTPIRRPAPPVVKVAPPPVEDDEDEEEETEEDEDEEEVEFPGRPIPVTSPKGEVRPLFGNRQTPPSPIRETPERRPVRLPDRQPVDEAPEFGAGASRSTQAEPEAPARPVPGNAVVEDRIKNVRDEGLRVKIKMVYHIARDKFGYDEDRVDSRSKQLYKKPTFELDAEQADDYYERIITAPLPKQR